jgi:hypothetical protein
MGFQKIVKFRDLGFLRHPIVSALEKKGKGSSRVTFGAGGGFHSSRLRAVGALWAE